MPRFNHAYTLGFSLESDHPTGDDIEPAVMRAAILIYLARLEDTELMENTGMPFDTYNTEEDVA